MKDRPGIGTLLVEGDEPVEARPIAPAIYRSTTYESGFFYGRYDSPNVAALERRVARLEGAEDAAAFGSGMAAVSTAVLAVLQAGDELVSAASIYGGSYRLFRDHLSRFGITTRFVDGNRLSDPATYGAAKLCWLETPVNPTLRILDLPAIARAAAARGVPTLIDATFATPVLLRPLTHGITAVVHSATKYLNGHSDVLAGVVAGPSALIAKVRELRKHLGGILDPQAAYELSRGMATLEVRVRRQSDTALVVARFLEAQPGVERVLHPGLPSHPDHALAARLLPEGCGGMLTFTVRGGEAGALRVFEGLRRVRRAPSLGGVESLASLPVRSSHTGFSAQELARAGVEPGMIRLSVGLEDPADLTQDLGRALAQSQE